LEIAFPRPPSCKPFLSGKGRMIGF